MTEHNATWTEEQYYQGDDFGIREEDCDPRSEGHSKSGYWNYPDEW